ncbi:uncharacterized protein ACOB8E_007800 isoform 1-T1 [Sarcophilus harrisii]
MYMSHRWGSEEFLTKQQIKNIIECEVLSEKNEILSQNDDDDDDDDDNNNNEEDNKGGDVIMIMLLAVYKYLIFSQNNPGNVPEVWKSQIMRGNENGWKDGSVSEPLSSSDGLLIIKVHGGLVEERLALVSGRPNIKLSLIPVM